MSISADSLDDGFHHLRPGAAASILQPRIAGGCIATFNISIDTDGPNSIDPHCGNTSRDLHRQLMQSAASRRHQGPGLAP